MKLTSISDEELADKLAQRYVSPHGENNITRAKEWIRMHHLEVSITLQAQLEADQKVLEACEKRVVELQTKLMNLGVGFHKKVEKEAQEKVREIFEEIESGIKLKFQSMVFASGRAITGGQLYKELLPIIQTLEQKYLEYK